MMESEEMRLARLLYRAYGESANWKNFKGDPMPSWNELPGLQQQHWVAVALFAIDWFSSGAKILAQPE